MAKRSKVRPLAALVLDWFIVLWVVGGAFAGLGLVGMAAAMPCKIAYEQGKEIRLFEQREADLRRSCLATREANSRFDAKAMLAEVRLPARGVMPTPGWPAAVRMAAAHAAQPSRLTPGHRSGLFSLPMVGRRDAGNRVPPPASRPVANIDPRG